MVPGGGRHATIDAGAVVGAAFGAVPVVRGTRGDRAVACAGPRGAGGRPAARAGGVDGLARAAAQRCDAGRRPGVPRHHGPVARRAGRAASEAGEADHELDAAGVRARPVGRRRRRSGRGSGRRAGGGLERAAPRAPGGGGRPGGAGALGGRPHILGLHSSAIGTLVARTTRFTMLLHLPRMPGHGEGARVKNGPALARHGAEAVRDAITRTITTLPEALRRSLTWDQGTEMSQHAQLRIDTGVRVYFCDPHSPWQRGTNENTNGLLRQYFPKGTDLSAHGADDLAAVAAALNGRPRKTLGWRTPAEALDEELRSAQTR